ncbi:hypothetical protein CsSME_00013765 [Camellia sinensis var. sinensis]
MFQTPASNTNTNTIYPQPTKPLPYSPYKYTHSQHIISIFSLSPSCITRIMSSSTISKNNPPLSEVTDHISEDREETETKPNFVTSHLQLKPHPHNGTMEKEVVLRRIRHHKRMNKLCKAAQALLSSPFAAKPGKVSVHEKRWVDDAFAAP